MEWLKNLELSLWWRALFAAGIALVVAGKGADVSIIGFGLAAIDLGEWINHPRVGEMVGAYLKSWYERRPCISGLLLDAVGSGLTLFGFYRLLTT